ncbi:MAG: outer membrane beta-barrel protein [Verrucomicrobiales bacterium]
MKPRLLKTSLLAFFGGILLSPAANAGDYYSPSAKQQVLPPAPVDTGFYFKGFGGILFLDDIHGTGSANIAADFDSGWIAGAALGYELTPALSIELEGATGEADIDALVVNGARIGAFSGDLDYSQIAVNLIYEFGPQNPITPYVGVGLGAGFADLDVAFPGTRFNDDDAAFLYQLIGGVNVDLGPRTELFAEYRFGSLDEFTLQRGGVGRVTFDELQSHQALLGVKIKF